MEHSRRAFIKKTGLAAAALPLIRPLDSLAWEDPSESLQIHIFSKNMQFLDLKTAAERAAEIGFEGIDLTVRPGGHVLPGEVSEALPKALEAIKSGGSSCTIVTTAVENIANKADIRVLETASELGIAYYRTNWFQYDESSTLDASLKKYREAIRELSGFNGKRGLIGCYENHAGLLIGASPWELWELLKDADPGHFGVQYDIRHAAVEGGLSWENGLRLLKDHIKNITLKDFKWEQRGGSWQPVNTPIGEGQVDFNKYFGLLKKYKVRVPAILHMEYALGGAENGLSKLTVPQADVFNAMKRDLKRIREIWAAA